MELHDVKRSRFAAPDFTDEPVPDQVPYRILDRARFAPSGGNRRGWRVTMVRDPGTREAMVCVPLGRSVKQLAGLKRYCVLDVSTLECWQGPALERGA